MEIKKFYIQPLGLLRGCSTSSYHFLKLNGSNIQFSALKIITRIENEIEEEVIAVNQLDDYLSTQADSKKVYLERLLVNITTQHKPLYFKNGLMINWQKPVIQGVLNITPDSFSDGGTYESYDAALKQAQFMIKAGADIIDIGGESTRPGANPISIEEEKKRTIPIIKKLSAKDIVLSIDSRNADVMKEAVGAGVHIINDVSALDHDPESINLVKRTDVPVVLMHAQGSPDFMQNKPEYRNVVLDIYNYFESKIELCVAAGIAKNKIIIDPGIGFGKTVHHNLQLLNNLALFHGLGVPILIGVSRKSFIGKISNVDIPDKRLAGSIAAAQVCLDQGVQIIRVHDVEETCQAVATWDAICNI